MVPTITIPERPLMWSDQRIGSVSHQPGGTYYFTLDEHAPHIDATRAIALELASVSASEPLDVVINTSQRIHKQTPAPEIQQLSKELFDLGRAIHSKKGTMVVCGLPPTALELFTRFFSFTTAENPEAAATIIADSRLNNHH